MQDYRHFFRRLRPPCPFRLMGLMSRFYIIYCAKERNWLSHLTRYLTGFGIKTLSPLYGNNSQWIPYLFFCRRRHIKMSGSVHCRLAARPPSHMAPFAFFLFPWQRKQGGLDRRQPRLNFQRLWMHRSWAAAPARYALLISTSRPPSLTRRISFGVFDSLQIGLTHPLYPAQEFHPNYLHHLPLSLRLPQS